ncbi:MAG: aldehyde dehydrogenase [Sulfuriferula multivorans]|jgi:thiamine pyrophosphate-dependent acetolactate synthase large subunit-like protein|uniref:Aldehyde dehydrogenase n=1 Tax=Sulfuriferula multivorans TaxID=1559896 RepID=A0A7C9NRK9_9PROT|nr:aldehyde dehydrogenase [Sulfuriferula multivorans]
MSATNSTALNRRAAVARLLRDRGDAIVVTSLGNPTFDVSAAGDTPLNFYLWGAMGGAAMVGLGMAIAQPKRRVVAIVGDGEMMMALGSLATIACEKQANLAVVVLNNEHYAETGMQPAHAGRGVDLVGVARATGFKDVSSVNTEEELESLSSRLFSSAEPLFSTIKISTDPNPVSLPPRDGPYLRSRFREAILGAAASK